MVLYSVKSLAIDITLGTQEWSPYHIKTSGRNSGIAFPVLNCIFDKTGGKVSYKFLPWARAQMLVKMGELDGFLLASQNEARDNFAVIWYVYFLKQKQPIVSIQELKKGHVIGVRPSSNPEYWATKQGLKASSSVSKVSGIIKILDSGRIDYYMENRLVFEDELHKTGHNPKKYGSYFIKEAPLGIYFGKKF